MVREYCEDIKNSGINRKGFPASCSSYMEMGMYASVDTIRELNKVFEAAGLVELSKYKNNTLNEANIEQIKKTVMDKAQEVLTKFWEKIKAAFEKVISFLMNGFAKATDVANKFKKITLNNHADAIKAAFENEGKAKRTLYDLNTIEDMKNKLSSAKYKISQEISSSNSFDKYSEPFSALMQKAFSMSVKNGSAFAKAAMTDYAKKHGKEITYKFIIDNKNGIAKTITESPAQVKKAYSDAKAAISDTKTKIKSFAKGNDGAALKEGSLALAHLEIAYQNCLLGLLDLQRMAFVHAVQIATRCLIIGSPELKEKAKVAKQKEKDAKAHEKAMDKLNKAKAEEKQATGESAYVDTGKFDDGFINEAFNW